MIIEQHVNAPHDTELLPPSTPRVIQIDPDSDKASGAGSWGSPAFLRSARSSYGGTLDSAYDPFAEEDGFVPGRGRKKPRYSLRREEWRILDEPESPREREGTVDWDQVIEDELSTEKTTSGAPESQPDTETQLHEATQVKNQVEIEDPFQGQPAIFVKRALEQADATSSWHEPWPNASSPSPIDASSQTPFGSSLHLPTDTPMLHPIASPGLLTPSPLVSNLSNGQSYFSGSHAASRPQEAQLISMGTNITTPIEQSSSVDVSPTTQPQTGSAAVEEFEPAQTYEQHRLLNGPSADTNDAISANSMGFIDTPPVEIDSSGIDLAVNAQTSGMPIVRVDAQADQGLEEQVEAEPGMEQGDEIQREDESEAEDKMGQEDLESDEETEEEAESEDELSQFASEVQDRDITSHRIPAMELQTEHMPAHPPGDTLDVQSIDREPEEDEYAEPSEGEALDIPSSARSPLVRSPDYSGDESHVAGDEALSDEEDDMRYNSQGDEEEEVGEEEEDDLDDELNVETSRPVQRPRPQEAQPEVIVLDSDSEDEPASDKPTPQPVQGENTFRPSVQTSPSISAAEGYEDEDMSSVDQEQGYDEWDDEDQAEDNETLHDSDLEDESSVDELLQDQHDKQSLNRAASFEQEQDTRNEAKIGSAPGSAVDLDSDEEEPQEDWGAQERDEDDRPHRPVPDFRSLDGAHDNGGLQGRIDAENDEPESAGEESDIQETSGRSSEDVSSAQVAAGSPPHTFTAPASIKPAHGQLLSPYPTQEAVPGRQGAQRRDEVEIESGPDMQESSLGLNISLTGASGIAAGDNATPLNCPEPEIPPEVDIAVLTAESVDEQEKADHLAAPATPAVVVSKPPVPDRHAHGLRSKLSYFAPLATLVDHYNALVDTLCVVHETTSIAKATSASKDYFMTIQLTDPSMAGTTLQAQIFRRYKSAMPSLAEGNVVLLRNFKVRSYDHSIMLVSVESSSWAVFDGSSPEAQINGPPVEYGSEERAYASGLRRWYSEVGESMAADNKLQASVERDSMDREATPSDFAFSESGSIDSVSRGDSVQSARGPRRSRKSHRRITIHELRDGTRYTEVGSPSSRESIHELRDGTAYANL